MHVLQQIISERNFWLHHQNFPKNFFKTSVKSTTTRALVWRDPRTGTVLAPGAIQNWPEDKTQKCKMRSIRYVRKTTGYVAPSPICVHLLFSHYKNREQVEQYLVYHADAMQLAAFRKWLIRPYDF